jgi:hypothetical protein
VERSPVPIGSEITVPAAKYWPIVLGVAWFETDELLALLDAVLAAPPDHVYSEPERARAENALARLEQLNEYAESIIEPTTNIQIVRVPLRWSVRYSFPENADLASLTLDLRLSLRGYVIERVEARGPADAPLDLEALRRFGFKEALRQSLFDLLGQLPETAKAFLKVFSERDTESLEQVALVYGLAQLLGDAPTSAVAGVFHITPAAAAQRVRRARAAGLLPPVKTSKKGKPNAKKEHTDLRPPERAETDPLPRAGRDAVQGDVRNPRRGQGSPRRGADRRAPGAVH